MPRRPVSRPATIDETAEHFRISRRHVQYLIQKGVLVPYSRLGRSVRIDLIEADAALKGRS